MHGEFIFKTKWKIHKHKIKKILLKEVLTKCLDICMYFKIEKIKTEINKLPEIMDLSRDKDWLVEYRKIFSGT